MDEPLDHFVQQEFTALREEIRELKSRRFRVITLGVVGTPVIFGIAEQLNITIVLLLVPLLVVATVLLEVSENNGIYRAGQYISDVIENYYLDSSVRARYPGWETWLEDKANKESRRHADRIINIAFLIIFCVYYAAYAFTAVIELDKAVHSVSLPDYWKGLTASLVYLLIFLQMLYFYYKRCLWCTDARSEKEARRCG
jgi:hypothetical protein